MILYPLQAGIMEEMMEDTLDMEEDDELEEEADAEVDKVLFELTNGKLGEAGAAGTELPVRTIRRVLLTTDLVSGNGGQHVGRQGDRGNYGKVQTTVEWYPQQLSNRQFPWVYNSCIYSIMTMTLG